MPAQFISDPEKEILRFVYECYLANIDPQTVANYIRMAWSDHSGSSKISGLKDRDTAAAVKNYDETRQYIKLDKSFRDQLKNYNELFNANDEYLLLEGMKLSSSVLLKCVPETLSIQLTNDKSLFYTVIKDDIIIYLEHYPMGEREGLDEAVLTIFQNKKSLLHTSGELIDVIENANKILSSFNIAIPQFA